jgi:hypothetical protein
MSTRSEPSGSRTRRTAHGERAARAPHRHPHRAGVDQLAEPGGEHLAGGQRLQDAGREGVLSRGPGAGPGVVLVLEPAVRIGHGVPVQGLDEVEPRGVGIAHRAHRNGGPDPSSAYCRSARAPSRVRMEPARGSHWSSSSRPAVRRRRRCSVPRAASGSSTVGHPGPRRDPHTRPLAPVPSAGTAGATLLLNATYEPLCVVSTRRAIVLVLAE